MAQESSTTTTNSAFAQAQARLFARRRAREAEEAAAAAAAAAVAASASDVRARIASAQSPLARRLGASTLAAWDAVSGREGTRPAFRVGQVDAELLDEELVDLLRRQVGDAVRYLGGPAARVEGVGGGQGGVMAEWEPEILLALRAVLFKLTVWDHDATYGASLQNLKYTDARRAGPVFVPPTWWQKSLFGLVTVGGRYAWTKWEGWLLDQDDGFNQPSARMQRLSRLTSSMSTLHAAAAFASFLAFLLHGRYRTLLDRILRMRLAPPTSQISREVSFEYLNRQLVWHAFTEFLLFVLPLVGINRWRRWLARTWRKKTKDIVKSSPEPGEITEKAGELAFLPERTCAICYHDQNSATTEDEILAAAVATGVAGSSQTDVTNPYETIPCGCVYCFVCLATRIEREEGEGWVCLRCGELVKECKPWNGDVLASPSKSPTTKTVGFADNAKDAAENEAYDGSHLDSFKDAKTLDQGSISNNAGCEIDPSVKNSSENGEGEDEMVRDTDVEVE